MFCGEPDGSQVTELAALQAVVSRTHARGYQITEESGGGGGGRARRLSQISLAAEIGHVRQAAQAAAAFKLAVEEEPGPVRRPSQSLSLKDKVKVPARRWSMCVWHACLVVTVMGIECASSSVFVCPVCF